MNSYTNALLQKLDLLFMGILHTENQVWGVQQQVDYTKDDTEVVGKQAILHKSVQSNKTVVDQSSTGLQPKTSGVSLSFRQQ